MRTQVSILLLLSALALAPASVDAQGFSSILTKLDALATRLVTLESRFGDVEGGHDAQLAEIEARARQDSAGGAGEMKRLSEALELLLQRMEGFEEDLHETREALRESADMGIVEEIQSDLQSLLGDLNIVLEEPPSAYPDPVLDSPPVTEPIHPPAAVDSEAVGPNDRALNGDAHESESDEVAPPLAGFEISGFVDASYFANNLDQVGSSFAVDQVEMNLIRKLGTSSSLRVDIEGVNHGEHGYEFDIEQAFVTFTPADLDPITITFGKFNAPIGFELLDAPDMFQFSHALVFDFGLPTNLTGAMVSADLGGGFDLAVHVSNGWDQNEDLHRGKAFGTRLGYAVGDVVTAGMSVLHEQDPDDGTEYLSVYDFDLSVTPVEALTFGAEFNRGTSTLDDTASKWWGVLVMGNVAFGDKYGFTVRYDRFEDQGAVRLGSGLEETRQAITLAPLVELGHGIGAVLEFRVDWSDFSVFENPDGAFQDNRYHLALELVYGF